MNEYQNNFVWVILIDNLLNSIETKHQININNENYQQIFNNLNQYLSLEDIIVNTDDYPYLFNAINNSINHQEKNHQIIFEESLRYENKNFFNPDEKLDLNKYVEIKDNIHQGLKKFFIEQEQKICQALEENNQLCNFHFKDAQDIIHNGLNIFAKLNLDNNKNTPEQIIPLIQKFSNNLINFLYSDFPNHFKIDTLKILSFLDNTENCNGFLMTDFDEPKNFNIQIDQNSPDLPKFSLMKFKQSNQFSTGCHAGAIYMPQASQKLFVCLFDHTMNNLERVLDCTQTSVCVEKRFEIMFEYLVSKNFNNNQSFKNFIDNISYQELYNDFDNFYEKYLMYPCNDIMKNFYQSHGSENAKYLHLSDKNNFPLINIVTETNDHNIGKTWQRTNEEMKKTSKESNIFSQIEQQLSFI